MKKLFAILALVLGMVSCQTEPEALDVVVGGEQEVMLSVSLPESTRANSAEGFDLNNLGNYKVRYILEISYNGNLIRDFKITDATTTKFPVRLAPNRDYTFTVWADLVTETDVENWYDADLYYNTASGLENIYFNNWTPNTEARDAWTATQTVTYTSSNKNIGLELKRPFAKVRVVATDIAEIRKFGIEPTNAVAVYAQEMYTEFDAVAGAAKGETTGKTLEFAYANVDTYEGANGEQLTLFADYVLVPADGNVQFTLSVFDNTKGANALIKTNNFNTTIPVVKNKVTTIKGNVLTDGGDLSVDIENGFDGENALVDSRNVAQSTLDNVIANTTIYLEPGVNYGTLYLRPVAGGAQTKEVDWIGNNYGFETYSLFENLTIVGAEGATVDAIKIEGGTYYNADHSQKETYPVMLSLIELKNVVFDGVTFTGKGGYDPEGYGNVVNLSGNNIKVDGLTFKNCVLNNNENNARLLYKTESTTHVHTYAYNGETYTFTPSLKNITITDCTLNGGYMGLELREAENITITNNEFNVNDRNILLPVNTGCTYSGNITITGNVSNNAKERFVRADGTGDAVVVISNNTLKNYLGEDADYIKVTNGNNVTIENNTLESVGVDSATAAQAALDNATPGTTIELQPGVNYGTLEFKANPDHSNTTLVDIADAWRYNYVRTIENVKIIGAQGAKVDGIVFKTGAQPGDCNNTAVIRNLTIDGVEFTDAFTESTAGYNAPIMITTSNATIDGLTVKNCKLIGNNAKLNLVYLYGADGSKNVTLSNNTVDGIARLCELRGTENVTIKDNTIKNTYEHAMLLAGSNYSGRVTITDNTAEEIHDRFVRMAGAGDAEVVIKDNTIINYRGTDADYIKVTDGNNITVDNNVFITTVATADELKVALTNGNSVILGADIAMTEAVAVSNANFTLDGNGKTITMTEGATNNIALFDITGGKATFKNVTFDGIQTGAVVRTVGAEFVANNITAQNCNHTVDQGLFRLFGESTITNSTFKNNICKMGVSFCFDHDTDSMGTCLYTLNIDGCEFAENTCSSTAVCYYANGLAATLNGNKFVNNTLNVSNGATVYLGFKKNCTVTNNLFDGNTVTATSKRSAGGLMVGNEATIRGNAFVNNTVTVNGATGYGNDVCASPYYAAIDLSGNYWGGGAPVENDDYYKEYNNYEVIINDYLTTNPIK